MHVGLFVDSLSPQLTGIGRYCWELASGLPAHPEVENVSYHIGRRRIADPAVLLRPGHGSARTGRWARTVERARRLVDRQPDIHHGPNYTLPDWAERGVVTIHDLSVFKYPEMHPPERVVSFERDFTKMLGRAAHLITDTETVRAEVIEFTGYPADKVTAVPLGISPSFRPHSAEARAAVRQRYDLPTGGYALTLSTLEPRKRIEALLRAWEHLPHQLRSRFPLVIAGASGWKNEVLHCEIERAAKAGWVIPLGFVAESDLPSLYAGASLFVYPSVYEGFGLPPIEAMASGVPTVVAGTSCLPEVTQGAAMLVDADDVTAFTMALAKALEDESWRAQAISAGVQVASTYTWDRCIAGTVGVYQRVLEGGSVYA